jgi:hypothetical protein
MPFETKTIKISAELHRRLSAEATERGIPLEELIRTYLGSSQDRRDQLRGNSGKTPAGVNVVTPLPEGGQSGAPENEAAEPSAGSTDYSKLRT